MAFPALLFRHATACAVDRVVVVHLRRVLLHNAPTWWLGLQGMGVRAGLPPQPFPPSNIAPMIRGLRLLFDVVPERPARLAPVPDSYVREQDHILQDTAAVQVRAHA